MKKGNLELVKPDTVPPVMPQQLQVSRQGVDLYVDSKDSCKEHNYRGQGWPKAVNDVGYTDEAYIVDGCAPCYEIWRQVHINPGTSRAGE